VARYRLRFLHQEFDLPRGATVIGRSLECNLTVEDPLVSRQHARIAVDDEGGIVEDLASRNGVRVNGIVVHTATRLHDGDRVRIGTQDFVFCRFNPTEKGHSRTTGVLRLCASCRLPYPREMVSCPNCEATEQTEEETLSGSFGAQDQAAWNFRLFVEALERALTLGRIVDAERIIRRASAQVEEAVAHGDPVDARGLAALAVQAVATTLAMDDPAWGLWVLDVYRRVGRVPPLEVVDCLAEVVAKHPGALRAALGDLLDKLNAVAGGVPVAGIDAFSRLEQMHRGLGESPGHAAEITGEWLEPLP
jgi:hypothetical protein